MIVSFSEMQGFHYEFQANLCFCGIIFIIILGSKENTLQVHSAHLLKRLSHELNLAFKDMHGQF
jgi:hypothetical protein